MMIRRISAVFLKECKDALKNKMIILIFFMFPILAIIFKFVMSSDEVASVVPSFMTMHIILVPILCMTSIISEEKEKGTLRVLMMSNVHPIEYLLGIGLCILLVASVSTGLFLFTYSIAIEFIPRFIAISLAGIICSILVGSVLGILAKNQMSAGPLAAPVSMILGLLPMFSNMNSSIKLVSKYLYSQCVSDVYMNIESKILNRQWLVLGLNILIVTIVFVIVYKKKNLSD